MKQCQKCGEKYYDSVVACPRDGEQLVLLRLKGISGWLGFYVWTHLIFLPMSVLMLMTYPESIKVIMSQAHMMPGEMPLYFKAIPCILAGVHWYVNLLLLKMDPTAVRKIKGVLTAWIVYYIFAVLLVFSPVVAIRNVWFGVGGMAKGLVVNTIWFFYFWRSRRVKDTFEAASSR